MGTARKGSKRARWIKALESGRYKQTTAFLHSHFEGDSRYCCLGVGARICGASAEDIGPFQELNEFDKQNGKDFCGLLGLDPKTESALFELNDDLGFSFKQIASLLKRGNKAVLRAYEKAKGWA